MSKVQKPAPEELRVITEHRRARFDYHIEEKLEAGLALRGSEVKSLRAGTVNLTDGYAIPKKNGELFLMNVHIGVYDAASYMGHEPTRPRKLLLHRAELDKWSVKVREKGYSIIPLMLYFKKGTVKAELALCTGKTHGDRRQAMKERETKREMDRAMRRR